MYVCKKLQAIRVSLFYELLIWQFKKKYLKSYVHLQQVWFIPIPCQNGVRLYKHDDVSLELFLFDQEQGLFRIKLEHMVRFTNDVTGTKPYSIQLHQLFNIIVLYMTQQQWRYLWAVNSVVYVSLSWVISKQ